MGKVIERGQAIATIAELNPKAKPDKIAIYVDAMLIYMEASENIARNGAITAHPRTGSPMENPYLKVRDNAAKVIQKFHLKTGDLWATQ